MLPLPDGGLAVGDFYGIIYLIPAGVFAGIGITGITKEPHAHLQDHDDDPRVLRRAMSRHLLGGGGGDAFNIPEEDKLENVIVGQRDP